jgi:hypothetical protein
MKLPDNIDEILIYYKLGYDIENEYLRNIIDLINAYIPADIVENTSYFDNDDTNFLYHYDGEYLHINVYLSKLYREIKYHRLDDDDISTVCRKILGISFHFFTDNLGYITCCERKVYLNTNRPNIISINHDYLRYEDSNTHRENVVFYDKNEDKIYDVEYREFEYRATTYIIGDIIEHDNIRVIDISSLKYFRKYTRVEQYDLFSIYKHNIVVLVSGGMHEKTLHLLCGNDSKYNNIGDILNNNPSLREYYSTAEKLLIHLLTNYDISKRDVPLEIIPNETRTKYIIEDKTYYAYSEEEAIVNHEETSRR